MNLLEQLKKYTLVVADTGDFERIRAYAPQDATTNPSLILKAAKLPAYQDFIQGIKKEHSGKSVEEIIDHLLVAFGLEILKVVPGRVSTEIDAELSFDIESSVTRGRHIADLYKSHNIPKERFLIKIAATWEGIQSARILEAEGIHCNLTLVFSLAQAVACAEAKVKLISPFVGRITDWYREEMGKNWDPLQMSGVDDPGVQFVTHVFNYFKHFDLKTEIMGASFRNIEQITALAGCDLLTISPELLDTLSSTEGVLSKSLDYLQAKHLKIEALENIHDEKHFRQYLNEDKMATEKLSEGIRNFTHDTDHLAQLLSH